MKIVNEFRGCYTRAAELLFGIHHTYIHLGRFKTPTTIIDDIVIKSPLVLAVEEAMNFIKKNIQVEYLFTGELQRKNRWQYPLQAIREMLLNSVIHKDYQDPTDVIVKIFDERIEISNPGNLFGNLTLEELEKNRYQSKHRNKLLAEGFYLIGEVEKYGTGLIRIRDWIKDYSELRFSLAQTRGSMVSTIEKIAQKITENVTEKRELSILELIYQDKFITTTELAKKLDVTRRTIARDIDILKNKGKIKRVGSDKGGHWEVINH